MSRATGCFSVNASEAEKIVSERQREGWRIFRLPAHITSADEFFEGVRRTLPLDPPLHSNRSWDALEDSLWAGLHSLGESRIVMVWPDAFEMEVHSPKDFAIAENILSELPPSLADTKLTVGVPKQLLVLRVV